MMALLAMMTMVAFLVGTIGHYWLREQAKKAGFAVSVFMNTDASPQIKQMIANAEPQQQRKLKRVALSMNICIILTFVGFIGLVFFSAFQ